MTTKTQNKKTRLTFLKIVIFVSITLFLIFTLLEVALRILGFNAYQIDFSVYPNVSGDITPRQDIVWHLKHINHSFHISINEQGFRNPGKATPEAYYRILCVGDSSTLGYGVDDEETYPARLASFLQPLFPGFIDVINAGTIGYTIDDELAYLKEKGGRLKPDLVVLEIFFNDVIEKVSRERLTQREFRKKSFPYTPLKSLWLKSAVYQLLREINVQILVRLGRYFPENPFDKVDLALHPEKYPDVWRSFDEKLKKFIKTVKELNSELIVVISPDKYQLYDWGYPLYDLKGVRSFQDHIIRILQQESVEYVDLLPVFAGRMKYDSALFVTYGLYDEHQSEIGQLIKAEEVYKKIKTLFREQGIYSLYESFPEATLQSSNRQGEAHQSRKWISANDSLGIALVGNITVKYENLYLGSEPVLIFGVDAPWWAKPSLKECILKLNVMVSEPETSTTTIVFTLDYHSNAPPKLPLDNVINLRRWKDKKINLLFTQQWEPLSEDHHPEKTPQIFIVSPVIMNGRAKGEL